MGLPSGITVQQRSHGSARGDLQRGSVGNMLLVYEVEDYEAEEGERREGTMRSVRPCLNTGRNAIPGMFNQ
jgi:hypothetical protein